MDGYMAGECAMMVKDQCTGASLHGWWMVLIANINTVVESDTGTDTSTHRYSRGFKNNFKAPGYRC